MAASLARTLRERQEVGGVVGFSAPGSPFSRAIAGEMVVADLDLFEMYRWLLALVCTVYTVVVTVRSVVNWLAYFRESRRTAVLGRYTLVLLLRMRLRRFAGELLQIAALVVVLVVLIYAHRGVGI